MAMRPTDTNVNAAFHRGAGVQTHQTADELTEGPPYRKDSQEVLVRGRDELYWG